MLGLLSALLAGAVGAPLAGERDLSGYTFIQYVEEFSKDYPEPEVVGLAGRPAGRSRSDREAIFKENLAMILEHNRDERKTWFATVNEFTDLTNEEFRARNTVRNMPVPWGLGGALEGPALQDLPEELDWRNTAGVVTPPKNQAACGGCWAFSAVETLESHLALATGKPAQELSPQQIISCAPNPKECGGTGGCQGSTQPLAFNYTLAAGIATAKDYPYRGVTGTCDATKIKPVGKNDGFKVLPPNNYTALVTAVATKGPIAISVAAGGLGWQIYGGGIMRKGPFNRGYDVDHAVQLVGYGSEKGVKYWLVRNSWGPWGESGYIRIERFGEGQEPCGQDTTPEHGMACKGDDDPKTYCGLCGILSSSSYPTGLHAAEALAVV